MRNDKTLLTVIVTIYNVVTYIARCIESIINQTYRNIEIILIDDGSTDGSGQICDKYARIDNRIITIHKENEGVVSARYQGIKSAHGKVIAFVDGDDWIEANMYEHMMSVYQREQPDMVSSGLFFDWKEKTEVLIDSVLEGVYEKELIRSKIFPQLAHNRRTKQQGITSSVCCKLFNISLLTEIMTLIDPLLTLGEDGAIVYCFVGKAEKVVVLHQTWYHYEQHENSANRTFGLIGFEKIARLKKCLFDGFAKMGVGELLNGQADIYVKGFLLLAIKDFYQINLEEHFYLFPFDVISKGSRVILYGAGKVGCSYVECLKNRNYANLVAWIDKDYTHLQKIGLPVEALETAIGKEYDYIVIAVDRKSIADEILEILKKHHVPKEKIVWKKETMLF